jgi:hypothetical protein
MFCDYLLQLRGRRKAKTKRKIKKMIKKSQIRRNLRLLVLLSTAFEGNGNIDSKPIFDFSRWKVIKAVLTIIIILKTPSNFIDGDKNCTDEL